MTANTTLLQRPDLVDQVDLDGEIVAFDGVDLHRLAGPAAAVWRLLDGALTLGDIAEVLSVAYGVELEEARRGVLDVAGRLQDLALVS